MVQKCAIVLTRLRNDRDPCQLWMKRYNAGRYIKASDTNAVDRMNTLLDSVSIPLEVAKANQSGFMYDPLFIMVRLILGKCNYIRTLDRISTNDTQSKEDSLSPSIVDHMYTSGESAGE